jgi:hypothetical protein
MTSVARQQVLNKQIYQSRCWVRAAAHQLRQDKHQDMKQKRQKLTSASWLRPVCGGFHNLIRFNCASFFESCRRHRVLTVTCLDACRCAAYLRASKTRFNGNSWISNRGTVFSVDTQTPRWSQKPRKPKKLGGHTGRWTDIRIYR